MESPAGLGIWIWELSACEGGDLEKIADNLVEWGCGWGVLKCGDKSRLPQFTKRFCDVMRDRSLVPLAWWYSHPSSVDAELEYLAALVRETGVAGLIMDAEEPWEREPTDWSKPRDWRAEAAVFANRLRASLGDGIYLGDAPWARPISHGSKFPYAEFGAVMNGRHPQFYWELAEKHGESFGHFMATADLQWAQTAPGSLVCPVGSCVDEQGVRHCPVDELALFDTRYAARQARSIWSYQHLNAAERNLLAQRAKARANVDVTDGGTDKPVFQAPAAKENGDG